MNRREFLKGTAAAGFTLPLLTPAPKPKLLPTPYNPHKPPSKATRDKTRREALKKWRKEFDFSKVEKEYAPELAVMIDNQYLWNEITVSKHSVDLQLVFDVYSQFVGRKLVSVQAMTRSVDVAIIERFKYTGLNQMEEGVIELVREEEEEMEAKTRLLESSCIPRTPLSSDWTARWLRDEITREIITDLRNNAGTVDTCTMKGRVGEKRNGHTMTRPDVILNDVHVCGCIIQRKTLRGKYDWMVVSPEMADQLTPTYLSLEWDRALEDLPTHGISWIGGLNGALDVYVDSLFPTKQILMGRRPRSVNKGWFYDAGYQYCPYVPFTPSGQGTLTRYAKKLVREGSKYYALLTVKNF